MASPTTPHVFRFVAATSLPEHRRCRYLDDVSLNIVNFKSPSWWPWNRLSRALSLRIRDHSGYLRASPWCEWGLSLGLCSQSVYGRFLYRFSTVFPSVVFHSASLTFVVRFLFIDNLVIHPLVGFCPHRLFNLPHPCYRPFLFHLSFPCLFCLILALFLSRLLLFYTLCGDRRLPILEFSFLAPGPAGGTAPSQTLSFHVVLFCGGERPNCFQAFTIVDKLSMNIPSQCIFRNFGFNHFSPGYPGDSCMDVEIFHHQQEVSNITTILDRSYIS